MKRHFNLMTKLRALEMAEEAENKQKTPSISKLTQPFYEVGWQTRIKLEELP